MALTQKSAENVFADRGRKTTADQKIIEEQNKDLVRLKDTIAEITTENLELKKRLETTGGKHEIPVP